jgi:hypothetical protein
VVPSAADRLLLDPLKGLHKKDPGRIGGKNYFLAQRRKGAKKTLETRQRFAPLRLCARNVLGQKHFLCKALR